MNHALLKSVIYDQHEFIRNFQIVPRDYEFEENGNYVLVVCAARKIHAAV